MRSFNVFKLIQLIVFTFLLFPLIRMKDSIADIFKIIIALVILLMSASKTPYMKTTILFVLLTGPLFVINNFAQHFHRDGVTIPTLEINLYARAMNGTMFLADGVLQNFNNSYSPGVDNMDVRKFMNASDNLAIKNGVYNLIVERRPGIQTTDTLRLMLTGTRIAPYRFSIDPSVLNFATIKGYLKDKYFGTETEVSMTAVTNINFEITADPLSRVADRFMIVYRNVSPVRFTGISTIRNQDNSITTKFNTENENNINTYTIEKSNDGLVFEVLGEQMPTSNNFGNPYYHYIDIHANLNAVWYRVKANTTSGSTVYSMIIKENKVIEKSLNEFKVFPNPVINGNININLVKQPQGLYTLQVINSRSQLIYSEKLNIEADYVKINIIIPGLLTGVYRLIVINKNGIKTTTTLLAK